MQRGRITEARKHFGLAWDAIRGKKETIPFNLRSKAEHKILFAFEADGEKYYEFDDANNIPCDRAFCALAFYEELQMRCTREFLQAHCQATEDAINNKNGISITNLAKLNQQLKERLELIYEPELVYKLASVVYFDESESPYSYDFKYGLQKIQRWKKQNVGDFFLSLPIKKLMPQTDLSKADLETSSKIVKLMTREQLDSIFTIASAKSKKTALFKSLESQLQEE
jgi:hypothetical protein